MRRAAAETQEYKGKISKITKNNRLNLNRFHGITGYTVQQYYYPQSEALSLMSIGEG
jgi:hypothetical protein